MTVSGWLQILIYLIVLVLLVKPLGSYMARIYADPGAGERTFIERLIGPFERMLYRLAGVQPTQEMDWKAYTLAMLLINLAGVAFLFILQRLQGFLPLNPQGFGPVSPFLAINTAVSFVTNTNWQNYAGETSLSYLTQALGMTVQNFLSAATGMAILVALIRGLARRSAQTLGNFWVDLTRTILYILIPFSLLIALLLVSQGAVQTFVEYQKITPLQAGAVSNPVQTADQLLALGPAASQVAIKHLGTNGGGFFNTNAAHPFENPTPLSDLILILAQTAIPASLTYTFGKMVGDRRQGWAIFAAMMALLFVFIAAAYAAEATGNSRFQALGVDQTSSEFNPGGNMEGKEVRFGIAPSAMFATLTTATSTGAVNSSHDSFTPLGGMVPLVMIQLGEVVLGGVGSGLYGMLAFVIVAVFVAGLMVGRTPEYLGKKIESFEMKMAALVILIMPVIVLGFTALAVLIPTGKASIFNPGPHGFSEVLYAFSSMGNNNGSAFAGLSGNTPFYNLTGAAVMLVARYWLAIPMLAMAGSLVRKKVVPVSAGTLPTHTPMFIAWLITIILIVGALNFVPALALGPVVEHLMINLGF